MSVSKVLLLLFLLPVYMPAYVNAQQKGYTIDGNIGGLAEGEKVTYENDNYRNGIDEEVCLMVWLPSRFCIM